MECHIRNVDKTKYLKFKSQVISEGKTVNQVFLDFINEYANFSMDDFYNFLDGKQETKPEENDNAI